MRTPTPRQRHANARLGTQDVLTIRKRYAEGQSQRELCQVFGVSIVTIGRIVRGETWGWLGEDGRAEPDYLAPLPPATPELEAAAAASAKRLQELLAGDGVKEE